MYWHITSHKNSNWQRWLRTCLTEPYPITMMHYTWVWNEINKLLDAQVICSGHFNWSAPIIVVSKRDDGKCLVIDYRALNKVTQKFVWPLPRVEDIFSKISGARSLSTLDLCAGYQHIPLNEDSIPQNSFYISFWEIQISESSFITGTSTSILPRTDELKY